MRIVECATCHTMFRDNDDTAGVCPNGHQNYWSDDDVDDDDSFGDYGEDYLRKVIG
ncbi:hypothetical protein [Mycolicibacterium goodii]|uniref:hypothetical protein n=1 Tax=Mycolicibacterium goodii TaxID=134601 RepID=UPI001BDCC92C|nr:hypothetical protein [Mycolicibacterium goodii]MBU8834163.1 hypothetical protein [Mycolicibacterium goodii]